MTNFSEFFRFFAGSGYPITLGIMAMAVLLLFIVILIYIPTLTRKIFPHFGYAKYADYLPFKTVYNDNSMSLTDGSLIRVYRIHGLQTSMQDEATKAKFLDLRAQLFNQIRDNSTVLRFYTVRDAVDENTILVSVMAVNNEVGSIQDFTKVKSIIKDKKSKAYFHCDAVQAFGKIHFFTSCLSGFRGAGLRRRPLRSRSTDRAGRRDLAVERMRD